MGHELTIAIPGYGSLGLSGPDREWEILDDTGPVVMAFRDDAAFDRPGVYGPTPGTGYDDNWWRYGRFSEAVAGLGADFDLLHLHDAHVAPAATVCATPAILTVHNGAHQMGGDLADVVSLLGLSHGGRNPAADLDWHGAANFLKGGVVAARAVTTVSPTHGRELMEAATGFGLADIMRTVGVVGIMNGIDVDVWDPATDDALAVRYSARSPARRTANRKALLEMTGLDDGVVFGNVGRMALQKGLGLVGYHLGALVDEGLRLVLVGNGEMDDMVDGWVADFPHAVAHLPYDEATARLVYGAADVYLMPSEFEPSGLGQLYAMRYGAPPLVHATGGLADSVTDIDEDPPHGTGFVFRQFNAEEFAKTARRAMRYRSITSVWRTMQRNGMTSDFSWEARAVEYDAVFRSVVGG
jgi:starch synthase